MTPDRSELTLGRSVGDKMASSSNPSAHVADATETVALSLLVEARTQLFALCEATQDEVHDIAQSDTEGKMGAYARGRKVEAKGIARAMDDVFRSLIARAEEDAAIAKAEGQS